MQFPNDIMLVHNREADFPLGVRHGPIIFLEKELYMKGLDVARVAWTTYRILYWRKTEDTFRYVVCVLCIHVKEQVYAMLTV